MLVIQTTKTTAFASLPEPGTKSCNFKKYNVLLGLFVV